MQSWKKYKLYKTVDDAQFFMTLARDIKCKINMDETQTSSIKMDQQNQLQTSIGSWWEHKNVKLWNGSCQNVVMW